MQLHEFKPKNHQPFQMVSLWISKPNVHIESREVLVCTYVHFSFMKSHRIGCHMFDFFIFFTIIVSVIFFIHSHSFEIDSFNIVNRIIKKQITSMCKDKKYNVRKCLVYILESRQIDLAFDAWVLVGKVRIFFHTCLCHVCTLFFLIT